MTVISDSTGPSVASGAAMKKTFTSTLKGMYLVQRFYAGHMNDEIVGDGIRRDLQRERES